MALAVSLTSESNPAPATLTKCRLPRSVVTGRRRSARVFGVASSRTAASKLPAPIVLAKSSPVPAGRTARAASVPISPLAAQDTVPSPPDHRDDPGALARDTPRRGLHVGGRLRDRT